MAKAFAENFYRSKAWRKCRQSFIQQRIKIDGGLCQKCKERQGYIVHHKIALTEENINDPEVSLNHANLEYQCKPCHDLEDGHGLNRKSFPLLDFDDNGDPIPPLKNFAGVFDEHRAPSLRKMRGSFRVTPPPLIKTRP